MSAFTPTRGGVWDRVARRLAQAPRGSEMRRTVPRGQRPFTEDRWKRDRTRRNPEGKLYEPCPMCSKVASIRTVLGDDTIWKCSSCGYYESDKLGPLN